MSERIAVIGLGYVGLPVAVGFARHFENVVGFDINARRVAQLQDNLDHTGEVDTSELEKSTLRVTADPEELAGATFFVVTVPTPIDGDRRPDLGPVISASKTVAAYLSKGAVVVYESTVYPGVTEEVCGPLLEELSGLRCGVDFTLGYSPERINPGDKVHRLETITKVVSGQDEATLERVAYAYEKVVTAGVHRAPTIMVAEAAKVIENTQRDLNIALMNELALIFDRLGIRTADVLAAAGTKWNFLKFHPGLVGGHCIGVDPYYLTARAEAKGYHPQVILAGRRINDGMGAWIAQQAIKSMTLRGRTVRDARVGVLGLTFKENCPDLRNSRVPDIIAELQSYGIQPIVHDPMADPQEAQQEYGVVLSALDGFKELDALIVAVSHDAYRNEGAAGIAARVKGDGMVLDVKSIFEPSDFPASIHYWSL